MAKDWTTIQPSLDPILEPINAVIETIDSVLSFLIALLNVVQFILNIVKAFLIGLINPIRAIIEAIIEEIRQIIADLRQAGLYIADDYNLFSVQPVNTTQKLLGGYTEYEKRMLSRLLNRADPSRPDLSSATTVIAMFAYISSGDLSALVELIRRIRAFFGKREQGPAAPFPTPTTPQAKLGEYGEKSNTFLPVSRITRAPDAVSLTWTMPSTGTPFSTPPKGFLVHVSTVPDGFGVRCFMPARESTLETENVPSRMLAAVDPVDGTELRLYGGASDIDFGASNGVFYNPYGQEVEKKDPPPQAAYINFALDQNTPLTQPDDYIEGFPLGGATFYFSQPFSGLLPAGSSYTCTLPKEDLPRAIKITNGIATPEGEADTFYIRVRPVTAEYSSNLGITNSGGTPRAPSLIQPNGSGSLYTITNDDVVSATGIILNPSAGSKNTGLYGRASEPVKVTFPSASQLEYQDALKAALVVLILVRPDLVEEAYNAVDGTTQPTFNTYARGYATGLEGFGKDLLERLKTKGGFDYEGSADALTFKSQIIKAVEEVADEMLYNYKPSSTILEALSNEIAEINDFEWNDLDSELPPTGILLTLDENTPVLGYGSNPHTWAGEEGVKLLRSPPDYTTTPTWANLWLRRTATFPARFNRSGVNIAQKTGFIAGQGWSDMCPVLYQNPLERNEERFVTVSYVRDLLVRVDQGNLLRSVATLLQIHGALETQIPPGQWTAIRFLDKVIKPLDTLLTDIDAFLQAILDGLQGVIDKIVAYIEGIQARIYQLQALIEKIRSLLNSLTLFDLPSFSGLVLVENGTDGIASALVTAGNKPTDGAGTYAAGVVVLFGGLPAVLLETIALLLGGGED